MKSKLSRRRFLASAAAAAIPSAMSNAQPRASALLSMFSGDTPSAGSNNTAWRDAGVIDVSHSPYAKLKTVPVRAVVIQEGFWSQRRKTNLETSIPSMHDELVAHGRMDNFLRLTGNSSAPQKGPVFSDSDIYKWTEAVGFALQSGDRPGLRKTTDEMIREVVAIQESNGYLNTYYVEDKKPLRMTYPIQTTGHELYNIGHMLQGAIAYYRATGDPTLLEAGERFVDNFLLPDYGPGPNQKGIVSGHPEIESVFNRALPHYRQAPIPRTVRLHPLHGDERIPLLPAQTTYMFCGIPFTSRTKLQGHAVRAMYACCGAADYYIETGDPAYWMTLNTPLERLRRTSALRNRRRRGAPVKVKPSWRLLRAAQRPRLR